MPIDEDKQREKRRLQRAEWKSPSPFLNVVERRHSSSEQRRKSLLAQMRGTARKPDGTLQHEPPPVTLPVVKFLTLDEIEAKYGRIE